MFVFVIAASVLWIPLPYSFYLFLANLLSLGLTLSKSPSPPLLHDYMPYKHFPPSTLQLIFITILPFLPSTLRLIFITILPFLPPLYVYPSYPQLIHCSTSLYLWIKILNGYPCNVSFLSFFFVKEISSKMIRLSCKFGVIFKNNSCCHRWFFCYLCFRLLFRFLIINLGAIIMWCWRRDHCKLIFIFLLSFMIAY